MNIQKISCVDCNTSGLPATHEVHTVDLSADEFAELRFLVDLSRVLESKNHDTQPLNSKFVTIIVETKDGRFEKTYVDELSDEIKELIDCVKLLSKIHADPLQTKSA